MLIGRKQLGVIFVNTNLPGHSGSHMFLIAGKHHCFVYSGILKVDHCLGGVLLDAVRYHYVAGILSVNSHMDYRALVMAGTPSGTYLIHQFAVAHGHALSVYGCQYSVTGGLLDIGYNTVILLVRICVTQGHCNGMGRVALHMGGQMQQFVVVYLLRMNGGGQTKTVKIELNKEAFSFYDEATDGLKFRPGRYRIMYGGSSLDSDLQSVELNVKK